MMGNINIISRYFSIITLNNWPFPTTPEEEGMPADTRILTFSFILLGTFMIYWLKEVLWGRRFQCLFSATKQTKSLLILKSLSENRWRRKCMPSSPKSFISTHFIRQQLLYDFILLSSWMGHMHMHMPMLLLLIGSYWRSIFLY